MLQLVGYRSWNASGSSDLIHKSDVEKGISIAQREITERILEATYRELSKNDREFIAAMLIDDGLTEQSDLAERLGKRSSHISTYKRRLLEAGVIEEPYPKTLKFAIPGFREFVEERVKTK